MIKLLLGLLGAMIIVGGGVWVFNMQKSADKITPNSIVTGTGKTPPVVCTMEALLCPDGKTYVSRTGSKCEFTACSVDTSRIAAGYVTGHVTIGPFCPVERPGVPCPVPPEAYSSRQAVVYYSDGVRVRDQMTLDKKGNYKFALGPGKYFIQIQPAGIRPSTGADAYTIGQGEKKSFTVVSFQTTTVDFNIDTGIR